MTDPAEQQVRDQRFRDEALSHLPHVSRFALSLTRNAADAEDLVQETYLRAYRAWDQFQPGTSCRAWLFTISRNTYLRTREREQRMIAVDDLELEALHAASSPTPPLLRDGDILAESELGPVIQRALDELPEHFRSSVILVDVEDQSYEAAAAVLNVPVGTLRSRLFRGRRLLREALRDYARDQGIGTGRVGTKEAPR